MVPRSYVFGGPCWPRGDTVLLEDSQGRGTLEAPPGGVLLLDLLLDGGAVVAVVVLLLQPSVAGMPGAVRYLSHTIFTQFSRSPV